LISATPQQVEVGVQDSTHGWVSVRAEMADGSVQATITPTSTAAEHSLRENLPGMSAYLEQQRVGVSGLTVSTAGESQMNMGRQGQDPSQQQQGQYAQSGYGQQGGGNYPQAQSQSYSSGSQIGAVSGVAGSGSGVSSGNGNSGVVTTMASAVAYGVGGQINVVA